MSTERKSDWLNDIDINIEGLEAQSDYIRKVIPIVTRNGQILIQGEDYSYDGIELKFIVEIGKNDVVSLIDPVIGSVRVISRFKELERVGNES